MTTSYETLDSAQDRELELRVRTFLFTRGHTALRAVSADVRGGVVTLRGTICSYYLRQVAVGCARRVAGVREVIDDICVEVEEDTSRKARRAHAPNGRMPAPLVPQNLSEKPATRKKRLSPAS